MRRQLTLGSLFDGIGGFPLAGILSGIRPEWASEIEPFPIRVTTKRIPRMKHLGDIHVLDGGAVEPVDIVTFGSPCQNLSVAGKRDGLSGAQSSLFFEAVRIIREMRRKTNGAQPRWAVWENVPGALSSSNGRDFREVLESLVRVKDPEADVPLPDKGKWLSAGEILGDGYSLAWRILDGSKGWGVAQRRRRIFAVLDLDGQCGGKVLFESEGLSGYTPPGGAAWQDPTGYAAVGAGAPGGERGAVAFEPGLLRRKGGHWWEEISGTLRAEMGDNRASVARIAEPSSATKAYGIGSDQSAGMLSNNPHVGIYEAETSRTLDRAGGNPACHQGGIAIVDVMTFARNQREEVLGLADQAGALSDSPCIHQQTFVLQGSTIGRGDENGPQGLGVHADVCFTLNTRDRHAVISDGNPSYCMTVGGFAQIETEKVPTLEARGYKDPPVVGKTPPSEYMVRRLTPGECARLQGYPDGWCDGLETPEPNAEEIAWWFSVFEIWRKAVGKSGRPRTAAQIANWLRSPKSDAAEYKAYGNSVAVPCVFFVLAGIAWVEETEGCP